jgi:hypothetical protein
MIVVLMKPTSRSRYSINRFILLSYVGINFQLFCIPLLHSTCTYIDVIISTHTQDNTHHEVPILTLVQDHSKLMDNCTDVANDESDNGDEDDL